VPLRSLRDGQESHASLPHSGIFASGASGQAFCGLGFLLESQFSHNLSSGRGPALLLISLRINMFPLNVFRNQQSQATVCRFRSSCFRVSSLLRPRFSSECPQNESSSQYTPGVCAPRPFFSEVRRCEQAYSRAGLLVREEAIF